MKFDFFGEVNSQIGKNLVEVSTQCSLSKTSLREMPDWMVGIDDVCVLQSVKHWDPKLTR